MGYFAKPMSEETRFVTFDPESEPLEVAALATSPREPSSHSSLPMNKPRGPDERISQNAAGLLKGSKAHAVTDPSRALRASDVLVTSSP